MAITYDSSNNIITITGSATFADIQTANDNGSWGVCTHTGDFYFITAFLTIGDGSTTSDLTDSNLQIQIGTSTVNASFTVTAGATLSLDNFSLIDYTDSPNYESCYGNLIMKNGFWKSNGNQNVWLYNQYTFSVMKFEGLRFVMQGVSGSSLDRVTSDDTLFYVFTDTSTFNDIKLSHEIAVDAGNNPTITNSSITAYGVCSFWLPNATSFCDVTFIDCIVSSWIGEVASSDNGDYLLHQIQTFKTIISSGGNNIQGANVFLKDINGTEEFSLTTDVDGTYPVQQAQQATYNRAGQATPTYFTPHTYRVRKYGYTYAESIKNISDKVREGTVIKPNGAITESNKATALGYTGITIDSTAKTITINDSTLTILKIYDYCQAWLMDNINVEEFLTTTSAKAFYVLHNNWTLVLQTKVTGYFNITGTVNVVAELDLDDIDITGDLHINTSANSTLNFNNIKVSGNVYNDDVNDTLTINASNSSLIAGDSGTGNGQTNIIQSATLNINGLQNNSEVRLYDSNFNEIGGVENSGTSVNFTYSQSYVGATLVVFNIKYDPISIKLDLALKDSSLTVQQIFDRNYKNPA